jgi:hypothetical protein
MRGVDGAEKMTDKFVIDGIIDEDGTAHFPPDAPRGKVRFTIEPVAHAEPTPEPALSPEEEAALNAELKELLSPEALKGQGLTAAEIAKSPAIGIWKDRTDITDSVEFVAKMREENRRRRLHRD